MELDRSALSTQLHQLLLQIHQLSIQPRLLLQHQIIPQVQPNLLPHHRLIVQLHLQEHRASLHMHQPLLQDLIHHPQTVISVHPQLNQLTTSRKPQQLLQWKPQHTLLATTPPPLLKAPTPQVPPPLPLPLTQQSAPPQLIPLQPLIQPDLLIPPTPLQAQTPQPPLITIQSQFNTLREMMEIYIILKLEKQCQDLLPKFIQTQEQMQTLMQMPRPLQLQMPEQMPKHIHQISMVRTLDLMFQ